MPEITIPGLDPRPSPPHPETTYLGASPPGDGQTYKVTLGTWAASLRNLVLRQKEYILGTGNVAWRSGDRVEFSSPAIMDKIIEPGTFIKVSATGTPIEKITKYVSPGIYEVIRGSTVWTTNAFSYKLPKLSTLSQDRSLKDDWDDASLNISCETTIGSNSIAASYNVISVEDNVSSESSVRTDNVKFKVVSPGPTDKAYIRGGFSTAETIVFSTLVSTGDIFIDALETDATTSLAAATFKTDAEITASPSAASLEIGRAASYRDVLIKADSMELSVPSGTTYVHFDKTLTINGNVIAFVAAENIEEGFVSAQLVSSTKFNNLAGNKPDWIRFEPFDFEKRVSISMPYNTTWRWVCYTNNDPVCLLNLDQAALGGGAYRTWALVGQDAYRQGRDYVDKRLPVLIRGSSVAVQWAPGSQSLVPQYFTLRSKGLYSLDVTLQYNTDRTYRPYNGDYLELGWTKDKGVTWRRDFASDLVNVISKTRENWWDDSKTQGSLKCVTTIYVDSEQIVCPYVQVDINASKRVFLPSVLSVQIVKVF